MSVAQPARKRTGAYQLEHWFAWLWVAPALFFVLVFLLYPTFDTIRMSLTNQGLYRLDNYDFVGLKNYIVIFTDKTMLEVLSNNLIWLVIGTIFTVGLGLIIAVLVDRVRIESFIKSAIFIPMAISFVAAGVTWKFIYDFEPPGQSQIGLLNAILTGTGHGPQPWLINAPGDTFALNIIYIWMWTGFCMVILSAALKGVPIEMLEAARCDGASELTIFWRIIVPMISPTIVVVSTTMVINILKIFDVVYTITGGNFHTSVVAMEYYTQFFTDGNFGQAAALSVLLLIVIVPIMLVNIRRFRAQEARR